MTPTTKMLANEQETISLYDLALIRIEEIQTDWSHEGLFEHSDKTGFNIVGENLYRGNTCDLRYVIKLWDESGSHKAILDKDYSEAVLLIKQGNGKCYGVLEISY